MTRTSTTLNGAASKAHQPFEKAQNSVDMDDDLFYENLKPQLEGLVRTPGDEVIDRILEYSRSTKK
ncbi:hypothetical protein [Pedobacter sp. SYP-B3415]|uniref:hypothetical protein n=1 Tax=Pedobacter sp. SYP-B3415 TaxID=2496641 RepID=UPI00101D94C6|nr:hypothetical protein [Pedobacter sp. SYP-B3415]